MKVAVLNACERKGYNAHGQTGIYNRVRAGGIVLDLVLVIGIRLVAPFASVA